MSTQLDVLWRPDTISDQYDNNFMSALYPKIGDPDVVMVHVERLPGAQEKGFILPMDAMYELRTGRVLDDNGLECQNRDVVDLVMDEVRRRIYAQ